MNTNSDIKYSSTARKKPGPTPSGIKKVAYFKRVPEDKLGIVSKAVDELIGGKMVPAGGAVVTDAVVKDLLDDIERLTNELQEEKLRVKMALEMDLDEKGKRGWREYFRLKEGTVVSEFDQG